MERPWPLTGRDEGLRQGRGRGPARCGGIVVAVPPAGTDGGHPADPAAGLSTDAGGVMARQPATCCAVTVPPSTADAHCLSRFMYLP